MFLSQHFAISMWNDLKGAQCFWPAVVLCQIHSKDDKCRDNECVFMYSQKDSRWDFGDRPTQWQFFQTVPQSPAAFLISREEKVLLISWFLPGRLHVSACRMTSTRQWVFALSPCAGKRVGSLQNVSALRPFGTRSNSERRSSCLRKTHSLPGRIKTLDEALGGASLRLIFI